MALTFVIFYPSTPLLTRNAEIAVGSLGVIVFVIGFVIYGMMRCFILDNLDKDAY
jgi:hypothetical protein